MEVAATKSTSGLVAACGEFISRVASQCDLRWTWITQHSDLTGNEEDVALSKIGANNVPMIRPELAVGMLNRGIRKAKRK